jgi:His-Xaa-Ser system protein HxsD
MTQRQAFFERQHTTADAIQRAAYRMSDRIALTLTTEDAAFRCTLLITSADAQPDEIVAEFQKEVLDETLRERIRNETKEVRNLIFALAFSQSGLVDQDE